MRNILVLTFSLAFCAPAVAFERGQVLNNYANALRMAEQTADAVIKGLNEVVLIDENIKALDLEIAAANRRITDLNRAAQDLNRAAIAANQIPPGMGGAGMGGAGGGKGGGRQAPQAPERAEMNKPTEFTAPEARGDVDTSDLRGFAVEPYKSSPGAMTEFTGFTPPQLGLGQAQQNLDPGSIAAAGAKNALKLQGGAKPGNPMGAGEMAGAAAAQAATAGAGAKAGQAGGGLASPPSGGGSMDGSSLAGVTGNGPANSEIVKRNQVLGQQMGDSGGGESAVATDAGVSEEIAQLPSPSGSSTTSPTRGKHNEIKNPQAFGAMLFVGYFDRKCKEPEGKAAFGVCAGAIGKVAAQGLLPFPAGAVLAGIYDRAVASVPETKKTESAAVQRDERPAGLLELLKFTSGK